MATRIQLRRDTAANWTAANPILAQGEEGHETDTGKRKVGDGVTAWAALPYYDDRFQTRAEKGQAGGYAPLDSGLLIPRQHIPAVAITSRFVVNSQAAQLGLTAQEGDVAIRTDLSRSYIHNGGTAGTMADWDELLTPTDQVQSVDGRTGTVTLGDLYAPASHVGSRTGHPLATSTADGLMGGSTDKAKLDGIEAGAYNRPSRDYTAPAWTNYTLTLAANTWTRLNSGAVGAVNEPRISIPILGAPPTGAKWSVEVSGFVRLYLSAAATVYIGANPDNGAMGAVNGLVYIAQASTHYGVPILRRVDITDPSIAHTIDFSINATAAVNATIVYNPMPLGKAYLVAA